MKTKITMVLFACALSAGCDIIAPPPPLLYIVDPQPVDATKQGSVFGSFKLVSGAPGGDMALATIDGLGVTGGGCLVFQNAREQVSCTTQAVCVDQKPSQAKYGYCNRASSDGTCWFTPLSDPCVRSGAKSLKLTESYELTTAKDPLGPSEKVRWRVMTCQGLVTAGCTMQKTGIEYTAYSIQYTTETGYGHYRFRFGDVTEP